MKIRIAIDGPAGAGKSTVARLVADRLGYVYIDTGAMYRAVTLKAIRRGISYEEIDKLTALAEKTELKLIGLRPGSDGILLCHIEMDGEDVSEEIRSAQVTLGVSPVSAVSGVRRVLAGQQQAMARRGGVVMDGRDIGTVIMPRAELKVFLLADVEERVRRRYRESIAKGQSVTESEIHRQVVERDHIDSHRTDSPLRPAVDAVLLDTTKLSVAAVIEQILALAGERGADVLT